MTMEALAAVMEMELTPCEFTLLMRIADSASDGTWHYPNWLSIYAETSLTRQQINRMLQGLWTDRLISVHGVLMLPIISEANREIGIALWDVERRTPDTTIKPRSEAIRPGFIYLIEGEGTPWHKIGLSAKPVERLKTLGTQGPFVHKLIHSFAVDDMVGCERVLHNHFGPKRAQGEWFNLDAADVAMIQRLDCGTVERLLASLAVEL